MSFLVEDGWDTTSYQGLLVQGKRKLIDDDAEKLRFARAASEERRPADPPRGVLIRIRPWTYISWDNTRMQRQD